MWNWCPARASRQRRPRRSVIRGRFSWPSAPSVRARRGPICADWELRRCSPSRPVESGPRGSTRLPASLLMPGSRDRARCGPSRSPGQVRRHDLGRVAYGYPRAGCGRRSGARAHRPAVSGASGGATVDTPRPGAAPTAGHPARSNGVSASVSRTDDLVSATEVIPRGARAIDSPTQVIAINRDRMASNRPSATPDKSAPSALPADGATEGRAASKPQGRSDGRTDQLRDRGDHQDRRRQTCGCRQRGNRDSPGRHRSCRCGRAGCWGRRHECRGDGKGRAKRGGGRYRRTCCIRNLCD